MVLLSFYKSGAYSEKYFLFFTLRIYPHPTVFLKLSSFPFMHLFPDEILNTSLSLNSQFSLFLIPRVFRISKLSIFPCTPVTNVLYWIDRIITYLCQKLFLLIVLIYRFI
ncbi:hypothetical protein EDEG_02594 [Edhazardia aedis USNM 41457]|uniref:Uncharacterized protein n=1 Tax=Edhazardia aedis (strain USNM 41457) TaxID=1003232 RepID=J9DNQ2_EDHAE|nr:hypothetical protein EDEG_02594 [Edhazardia aedis USNM 41457]|eukprot:EJW03012.1 hypothetical protein EDEG_02594 [Edhazardia aedis USNM 41457]